MSEINYDFSDSEIINLKKYRDQCQDYRLKERVIALILIGTLSASIIQVAEIMGKCKRTIENWLSQYITEGIASLTHCNNYKPKKSFLDFFQKNQIKIYVSFENPTTIKEVVHYIKEHYGIKYSIEGARKILMDLGLKNLKLKTMPGNAPSVETQKQFVEEYKKLRNETNSVTLFCDGMHLVHQNLPDFCWGDPAFPPIIETNTGRKRLNIFGAYNPEDYSFLHISSENNCNAERVIEFFTLISNTYSYIPVVKLIVDNARYFHAAMVREWLEKNNHIKLIFLPPYAPNLNLIERFWKYAKKQLVKNKYYKTYKEFRAKCFQFLNNIKDHTKKLEKLMVEKFQIVKA